MNYDGQPIRQAFKLLSNPVFICEDDLTYPVGDIIVDIPNYSKSDRIILQKSVLSIRLQYKFTSSPLLFVLKVGPDAYGDTAKFPNGAWCKEGDFVLVRTYSGTRFKIFGKEFRLINDDQVDAVVQDPRGLTRA